MCTLIFSVLLNATSSTTSSRNVSQKFYGASRTCKPSVNLGARDARSFACLAVSGTKACQPLKLTEGGIFEASVTTMRYGGEHDLKSRMTHPPPAPISKLNLCWRRACAMLSYTYRAALRLGGRGKWVWLSPQKFHPLSEVHPWTSSKTWLCCMGFSGLVNSYSIFCLIGSCLKCFFLFGDEFSTAAVDTVCFAG